MWQEVEAGCKGLRVRAKGAKQHKSVAKSLEDETKCRCVCSNVFEGGEQSTRVTARARVAVREPVVFWAISDFTGWLLCDPIKNDSQPRHPSAVSSAVRLSFLAPPSSRLDFMKHKTQGQPLMTPDISSSSRMPVTHTETRWPVAKVTKLGPLWPQEKLLSLPIPRATNMSAYWKPIGSALWVFPKTRCLKVGHKLYFASSLVNVAFQCLFVGEWASFLVAWRHLTFNPKCFH